MAVLTPYALNFSKKDARERIELTWSVSGDLQHAFEIEIYVNDGSTNPFYVVGKTQSYTSSVLLLENRLINGVEYKWRVRIYNQADQVGPWSDYSLIRASTRPAASITNIDEILYAQNYQFVGAYSQPEGVSIKSFQFRLYQNGQIIRQSDRIISSDVKATFSLESEQSYEMDLVVVSQNDIEGVSPRYTFSTEYKKPGQSTGIVSQNVKDQAAVRIQWVNNTIITLPTKINPQFVQGVFDQALNLADGNEVYYNQRYDGTSTHMLWAVPAVASDRFSGEIVRVRDQQKALIEIGYDQAGQKFYCKVKNNKQTFVRGSKRLTFNAGDPIFIAFTQYDCYIGLNGDFSRF